MPLRTKPVITRIKLTLASGSLTLPKTRPLQNSARTSFNMLGYIALVILSTAQENEVDAMRIRKKNSVNFQRPESLPKNWVICNPYGGWGGTDVCLDVMANLGGNHQVLSISNDALAGRFPTSSIMLRQAEIPGQAFITDYNVFRDS
ncbi:hypothetical protein BGZ57DRAFT_847463 [Hyaloscypha finlandica]|nr:hypothetical protein BGZ57DRAFT_847463 [Hyaloscypha finlandica]